MIMISVPPATKEGLLIPDTPQITQCSVSLPGQISVRHPQNTVKKFLIFFLKDFFYGGEALTSLELPQSYTCPYCARMGFTDVTLQEHVSAEHSETTFEVVSVLFSIKFPFYHFCGCLGVPFMCCNAWGRP